MLAPSRISLRSMPLRFISNDAGARAWGAVGYADRSASCVSPSYALLPFLPPKRIAEGAKAISPDIWRETL